MLEGLQGAGGLLGQVPQGAVFEGQVEIRGRKWGVGSMRLKEEKRVFKVDEMTRS